MSELDSLIDQYDEGTGSAEGNASLFTYADEGLETPQPTTPNLSQQDVADYAEGAGQDAVTQAMDPQAAQMAENRQQMAEQNQVSVDPELVFEGNAEKFGKSLVAGVGVVVNDIGNMMDYASMTLLPDEVRKSDTFMSLTERLPNFHEYGDALQNWGKVHQSPGLDEFTLDDLFKVEFWATDVAKTLPYMASMLIPGQAGASAATKAMTWAAKGAAKRGMFGSAKRLLKTRALGSAAKGATKGKEGIDAMLKGSGAMGVLASEGAAGVGLTSTGAGIAQFLGSGVATTSVIGAGLAGDVYNRALDMGLTEEEAQTAAHGTFVDNSKWFALNGMSWMVNFGGLSGKAFKAFNKAKGGAANAGQITKTFGQRIAQHAKRGTITGTFEGTEEMFQETYEEWIQEKNLAEAQGKDFEDYSDFFQSKSNRKTLGVSFAAGFLMGGRAGLMNSIAENGRVIANKRVSLDDDINMMENMNEAQKRTRVSEVIEAAVREDQVDGLNGFFDKLQKAGKLTTEQRAEYDQLVVDYAEIATTLPFQNDLTEAGQMAVFSMKVKENNLNKAEANLNALKDRSLQEAEANLEGEVLENKKAQIEAQHKVNIQNITNERADIKTGLAKIVSGKKYSSNTKVNDKARVKQIAEFESQTEEYNKLSDTEKAELKQEKANLEARIKEDSYAIDEAMDIMSEEEYAQFNKKGAAEKASKDIEEGNILKADEKIEDTKEKVKEGAKSIWDKAKDVAGKVKDKLTGKSDEDTKGEEGDITGKEESSETKSESSEEVSGKTEDGKLNSLLNKLTKSASEFKGKGSAVVKRVADTASKFADQAKNKELASTIVNMANEVVEKADASYLGHAAAMIKKARLMDKAGIHTTAETWVNEMKSFMVERMEAKGMENASEDSWLNNILTGIEASINKNLNKKSKTESEEQSTTEETSKEESTKEEAPKQTNLEQEATAIQRAKDAAAAVIANTKAAAKKIKTVDGRTKLGKAIQKLAKDFKAPSSKKSKSGVVDTTQDILSYYASYNPAVEGAIMEAASKKFPKKQLLILRNVIDEHGHEVSGYAMGSAVLAQQGGNLAETIMHEYGHVYYDMLKDNPSFQRGVQKIIGSDVYKETKELYAEDVLYTGTDGVVRTGGEILDKVMANVESMSESQQDTIIALAESMNANDHQTASKLFTELMVDLQEDGAIKVLPDNLQESIIEEAFVTSLAPRVATKLDLLFEKPAEVKEYKGFVKRTMSKVARMLTPADSKKILSELDRSFEELSVEEMYDRIADDFAKGTQGGSLNHKGSKKHKLHPTLGAAVYIAMDKIPETSFNNLTVEEIADKAIEFAQLDQQLNKKGEPIAISKEDRAEVVARVSKEKSLREGFTLAPTSKDNGVGNIYKAAGIKQQTLTDKEQEVETLEDLEETIESLDNVNITSDDTARMRAMDNSTTTFIRAIMRIANPKGKREEGQQRYQRTVLEARLLTMAKGERDNLGGFIKKFQTSNDPHVAKAREIMNERMSDTEVLAALGDIHNNYRNKFIENILNTTVTNDGRVVENLAVAASEKKVQDKIKRSANNTFFKSTSNNELRKDLVARINLAKTKIAEGQKLSLNDAIRIVVPILSFSDKDQYLDLDMLPGLRVAKGNRIMSIQEFVSDFIQDTELVDKRSGKTYLSQGQIPVQALSPVIKGLVIASRNKNAIKSVADVNGQTTLAFNMNNNLLNSAESIVKMAQTPKGRMLLAEEHLQLNEDGDLIGNPFILMAVALGEQGQADQALQIAFDGGVVSYEGRKGSKAVSYNEKTKDDIMQFDLESFASNWDARKPESGRTYYTQPISIFANSKRRYSIASPMMTTKRQKDLAIQNLIKSGIAKNTYKDGTSALGFRVNADGTYDISEQVDNTAQWLIDNPGLIKNNPILEKIATVVGSEVTITPEGMKLLEDYTFNFMVNSYHAQDLFIGKHNQAKSASDYIKRATGAIARHDGSLRGTSIEPMVFTTPKGMKTETDAGAYILPEDVKYVESRVGKRMGHGWKFVYYGSDKRGSDSNTNITDGKQMKDQDLYYKTFVQVLTPEFIEGSKELQAISDKLKARRQRTAGGETLNIAMFDSAAKKSPAIHMNAEGKMEAGMDVFAEMTEGSQAWNELDKAYMQGDKLIGIDGANMGIQLPMDKFRNEINTPTQHHAALLNDLTEGQIAKADEIIALEQELLDMAMEEDTSDILKEGGISTPESRAASKKAITSSISEGAVKTVSNGMAKMMNLTNPAMSQNLPSLSKFFGNATRNLIKRSSKIMTKGSIAVQGTSVGKNLRGFTDENGNEYLGSRYSVQKDGTVIRKESILPAEAIVPAGFKGEYLARVDQKFTNLTDAKKYADSMISEVAASTDKDNVGIKVKGLNRTFPSTRAAKEFLYGQIAIYKGEYMILGEEFLGSRIPAHGNQSRIVMEVKGFQKKVVDEEGNNRNNIIQVNGAVNQILGADHDGDAIFMNFKYSNPKSPREARVNLYTQKVMDFFSDVSMYEQLTATMDYESGVESRIKAIESRFPNAPKRNPQNSPMGAAQFFEENVQGSGMIGNIAALNNGMAYLSRYNVGTGAAMGISIDGDNRNEFTNDLSRKGANSLAFQNAVLLNIALDNTKNQFATKLGINPSTVGAVAVLNRLGFPVSKLDVIFNTPAAKKYSKFKGKKALRDSNYVNTTAAEAALLEMGLASDIETAKKMLVEAKKNISIETSPITGSQKAIDMKPEEKKSMVEILAMLEVTEGITKDIYAVNKLVGQHKSVTYNEQEANEFLTQINSVLDGSSTIGSENSEALKNLKNNGVIKSFMDRLKTTSAIYQTTQITGTDHAQNVFARIRKLTGNKQIAKPVGDEQSKVIKDYFVNILANHVPMLQKVNKYLGMTKEDRPKPKSNVLAASVRERLATIQMKDNNEFIEAISLTEKEGFANEPSKFTLSPNMDYINEYTQDYEILDVKEGFASLPADLQEDILLLDAILNEGGMRATSVQPLFDDKTLIALSKSIDSVHQQILDDKILIDEKQMAENIIMDNTDIIPLGMAVYKDSKTGKMEASRHGGKLIKDNTSDKAYKDLKISKAINGAQRSMLKDNSEHYIKVETPGGRLMIYKYKPVSKELVDKAKKDRVDLLEIAKKHGRYEYVGSTTDKPKGGKSELRNYKAVQRAVKSRPTALINNKKLKFNNTTAGSEAGFSNRTSPFTFEEYIEDKGHRVKTVLSNKKLNESLRELYDSYISNFNLAQEFDRTIIQTGKIEKVSKDRLVDYASLFQKLDPSAISGAHKAVVMEMARRAAEEQKASRNGLKWTDKGDISWLHAWFGSNNIPGHRPEIQRLVRLMEKEYGTFMDENVKFQTELNRLTKNLVRERMQKLDPYNLVAGRAANIRRWAAGSLSESWNKKIYDNMYDTVETVINGKPSFEMKLKSRQEFLATKPGKAEKEFYNFFVKTTNEYGKRTSSQLGERWKEGYIPHLQTSLKESMRQRGMFGLYDHMLQGSGDIDNVKVKGSNPVTGKSEVMSFHDWKYLFYTTQSAKSKRWFKSLFDGKQYKAAANLDVIRRRAEKLAKDGKHEDGSPISRNTQEIHGMMGTNMMSRFASSRGVKAAMFGSADLGRALSQYVNTTMFVYGNENFSGFKKMTPLLDGVIMLNKQKGNKNAVTYLENVWKRGFYNLGESQIGLGRLTDSAIHKLIKWTRIRYLSLGFSGGFGNLVVGKYNEYRSKGGKVVATGEKRYWLDRKKSWAVIAKNLNPESFAYDLIQGNDSTGISQILMSPYIGSEHYIQGAGLVGQFTESEWNRIGADGVVPADMQDKVDLYVENITRQHGYGYSKVDQIGIATYSWGKAIMQFKKWMPTSLAERFQKETIDRFGELRVGSNLQSFKVGAELATELMAGRMSVKDFKKFYKDLPKHKREAVQTFFRGMQVVSALQILSMIFGDSDDDELRSFARWADDSVDDIMFMTDPRRMKNMLEPASWSILESGATMVEGAATLDKQKFKGGLAGISWTASKVLNTSESAVDAVSED